LVGFWREGKTRVPGEKPFGARTRTDNKLNPHNDTGYRNQPPPLPPPHTHTHTHTHWWEGSALTTMSSLHHPIPRGVLRNNSDGDVQSPFFGLQFAIQGLMGG